MNWGICNTSQIRLWREDKDKNDKTLLCCLVFLDSLPPRIFLPTLLLSLLPTALKEFFFPPTSVWRLSSECLIRKENRFKTFFYFFFPNDCFVFVFSLQQSNKASPSRTAICVNKPDIIMHIIVINIKHHYHDALNMTHEFFIWPYIMRFHCGFYLFIFIQCQNIYADQAIKNVT